MTMLDYIYEQPSVFAKALEKAEEIAAPFVQAYARQKPGRLYIVASGTSRNAAQAAAPFMARVLGIEATVTAPSALPPIRGQQPFILFISQGGNSTNTIAAMKKLEQWPSLAITGDSNGRIASLYPQHVLLPCGPETVGPKTKGYTTTVLTLYLMALCAAKAVAALGGAANDEYFAHLQTAAAQFVGNIEHTRAWLDENKEDMLKISACFLAGKELRALVAREGALKLLETMLVPAEAYDFEEYLHGPASAIGEKLAGFYLLPPQADCDYERFLGLVRFHRQHSSMVYTAGVLPSTDKRDCVLSTTGQWYTAPFEQVLPCQMMGAVLPQTLGTAEKGMALFKELDKAISIKFEGGD